MDIQIIRSFIYFVLVSLIFFASPLSANADICKPESMVRLSPLNLASLNDGPSEKHDVAVQDWMDLVHIAGFSISPNGYWAAIVIYKADVEANGYRTALLIAPTAEKGEVQNLGSIGPLTFADVYYPLAIKPVWSPDSRKVAATAPDEDGTDQIFIWHRTGGPPNQVTYLERDALYATWLDNEKLLVSILGNGKDQELLRRQLFDKGVPYFEDHEFEDRYLGLSPALDRRGPEVLSQTICHTRLDYEPFSNKWMADRDYGLIVASTRGGDARKASVEDAELYRARARQEKLRISVEFKRYPKPDANASKHEENGRWFRIDGEDVTFQIRVEGRDDESFSGLRYLIEKRKVGSDRRLSPDPAGYYSRCDYSEVANRFVCVKESVATPPEIVSFGRNETTEMIVTDLNPQVRDWNTAKVDELTWRDPQGSDVYGLLYTPQGRKSGERLPLVVLPYYGASRDFIGTNVARMFNVQVLVGKGFAVLRPNPLRYSTTNDAGPAEKLRMMRGVHGVIMSGIESVVSMGVADPNRLGVAGLSQGAKYASYAISHSDRFHAAIVASTVVSPLQSAGASYASPHWLQDVNNMDDEGNIIFGADRYELEERMVSDWANSVNASLLVSTTDAEWVWSVEAVLALHNRGKPVEMIVYPDARHFKKWPRQIASDMQRNLDWFRFWLKGEEDADPVKAEQYIRWGKIRDERCARDDLEIPSYCRMKTGQIAKNDRR